jgi:hypothetical protein
MGPANTLVNLRFFRALSGFGTYKSLEKSNQVSDPNQVFSENQSSPEAPIGLGPFQSAPLNKIRFLILIKSVTGFDLIRKPDQIRWPD